MHIPSIRLSKTLLQKTGPSNHSIKKFVYSLISLNFHLFSFLPKGISGPWNRGQYFERQWSIKIRSTDLRTKHCLRSPCLGFSPGNELIRQLPFKIVSQSCPTLCNPVDCIQPDSSSPYFADGANWDKDKYTALPIVTVLSIILSVFELDIIQTY